MDREVNIVNEWHDDGERPSSRTLAHRPIYKFLVQPVPTVVTPPNLSAHKPAGDRASRYKDRPQMPSRCPCLEPVQSQYPAVDGYEANGSHRAPLGSIAASAASAAILLKEGPATLVNKVPFFSLICDHCDIFTASPRPNCGTHAHGAVTADRGPPHEITGYAATPGRARSPRQAAKTAKAALKMGKA